MFTGDEIAVQTFAVTRQLSSKRVRLVAEVNGITCFVKTFGDPLVQCTVDELKRLIGLTPLGVSRAQVPDYGPVLIARYLPDHQRFNNLTPTPELARALLPILWLDVWIQNNDRTGTNVLLHRDGSVIPIDESAAFKRESTFRLTPKGPWYHAVAPLAEGYRPAGWPPSRTAVTETLRRTMPRTWPTLAGLLGDRLPQVGDRWAAFWKDADRRVHAPTLEEAGKCDLCGRRLPWC
jgi:hypothetical protein